jgi:Inhibitor of vertebrate lysozyme (Ivy)
MPLDAGEPGEMPLRIAISVLAIIVVALSAIRESRAEDLPTLHDRVATTLYGPAYRQLFLGQKSIPAWIKEYNSTLKGTESPGMRVYFDGALFERYKVCDPRKCDSSYLVVLFTPGGREAWAVSHSDGQQQLYGYPDAVTRQHLLAAEKQS